MALPGSFSELYPNRFLHADLFKGKKATLTIKDIFIEELHGDKGKVPKVVVSFVERDLQLVLAKTNGFCFKRMFGNDPNTWIGKRVSWYPTTTSFGKETVECIRVWGSPDIAADMNITIPQGRKKPMEVVMHKVRAGECGWRGDKATEAVVEATESASAAEGLAEFTYTPLPASMDDEDVAR